VVRIHLSPVSSGGLAQLGERRLCTAEVAGSTPVSSTSRLTVPGHCGEVAIVFTRIFVPTDGTEASLRALRIATQLVARYDAELVVVTAVPVPDWLARQNMEHGAIERYVEGIAQKYLEEPLGLLREQTVGAEIRVVVGPVAESLVTEIEASGADLVVMGRRGRDEPKDLLLGSISDRVARHLKVPILLVP
jgi:nucleotide-binding universal stress UspA family protein